MTQPEIRTTKEIFSLLNSIKKEGSSLLYREEMVYGKEMNTLLHRQKLQSLASRGLAARNRLAEMIAPFILKIRMVF
jgi:hypothetical protein